MTNGRIARTRIARNWLFVPPLGGLPAILFSIAAILMPTAIQLSRSLEMDPVQCTLFCPFVLATALLCGWPFALGVAIASAAVCNTILMGHPYQFHWQKAELEGLASFVGSSFFVIGVVQLFRLTASRSLRQAGAKEEASGVVFSADGGQAWASWYGVDAPVRLGPQEEVARMMEDFLAQIDLGRRLAHRNPPSNEEPSKI